MSRRRLGVRVSDDYIARHPEADPSATELVINVVHTAELINRAGQHLSRRYGLSGGAFNLLQVVAGAEAPLTPSQIGERLVVTSATVTGVLDTLEKRGLVVRQRDPADRRRILIEVTDAARHLLADAGAELIEHEKEWAAPLTATERERLIGLLGKLQEHLRAIPPTP